MTLDLRAGIVGYGLAGEVFHAPLIDFVDGLQVAAIVTSRPERQDAARAAYPDAKVVGSVEAMWPVVDFVVLATPNRAHVPLALEAIERRVPVVVDKPLAISAADGERVVRAAADPGVPVTVFQNRRWDGDFLTVRRLVEQGELGDVVRFESRFERFRPQIKEGAWRELGDAAEGGGLLLDLGSHLVDQARVLFGHPVRVYSEVDRRRAGAQVDDDTFVALEHAGGVRSHLWMSSVAPMHGPRFRVSGLRAGVETFGLDPQESQLGDGLTPLDVEFGVGRDARLVEVDGERIVEPERGWYFSFYDGVRDALRDGAPMPVDARDSVAVLEILDAARRSAQTGSVVDLGGGA